MGYDSYECIDCYCRGGGNNPVKDHYNICMTCMDEITQEEQNNPRVTNCFSHWDRYCSDCVMCGKINCFIFRAPLCESCSNQAIENGKRKCSLGSCMNMRSHNEKGSCCGNCEFWYCNEHISNHGECTACGIWYCESCFENECNGTCLNCHNRI